MYNFTIYEAAPPNEAFCYFWTEMNGKRGCCEIDTCLSMYINSLSPVKTHQTIFSDTCGGQNRNIQMSAMLLHTVNNNQALKIIDQKYMGSGHSFMEVDSMHSAIESSKKNVDIFSVHEYENVFKMARSGRKNHKSGYHTREVFFSEFLDLKKLVQNTVTNKNSNEGDTVNWLKIKSFRYEKGKLNIIQYKYDLHDNQFHKINIASAR